jgi:hypothetical protein
MVCVDMYQWFSSRFIFRIKRAMWNFYSVFLVPKPRISGAWAQGYGNRYDSGTTREKKSKREMECLEIVSRVRGLYWPTNSKNQRLGNMFWNPVNFQSCYTAPKRGNSRRRKMRCSKLVSGRWNGEYYMFCGATGWRIQKWERTNTKDIVAVPQSQVEMGRPFGKNGPAQVGKHYVTVVCKNR